MVHVHISILMVHVHISILMVHVHISILTVHVHISILMVHVSMCIGNYCRPMYIASTNEEEPDGHLPVALELQEHIEPLLIVSQILQLSVYLYNHTTMNHNSYS